MAKNIVAKFEKVSIGQYLLTWSEIYKTYNKILSKEQTEYIHHEIYDKIKLPERATDGSAGYDFFAPFPVSIEKGSNIIIPTGIRCKIENGYFLMVAPRSGHGFKSKLVIANTVGIIDSDYYMNLSNEGHILIKIVYEGLSYSIEPIVKDTYGDFRLMSNPSNAPDEPFFSVDKGKGFCQGILLPYGLDINDKHVLGGVSNERTGGFGSTD